MVIEPEHTPETRHADSRRLSAEIGRNPQPRDHLRELKDVLGSFQSQLPGDLRYLRKLRSRNRRSRCNAQQPIPKSRTCNRKIPELIGSIIDSLQNPGECSFEVRRRSQQHRAKSGRNSRHSNCRHSVLHQSGHNLNHRPVEPLGNLPRIPYRPPHPASGYRSTIRPLRYLRQTTRSSRKTTFIRRELSIERFRCRAETTEGTMSAGRRGFQGSDCPSRGRRGGSELLDLRLDVCRRRSNSVEATRSSAN